MRLRSLGVRNYRVLHRLDVEFPDGLVGLVGPNGAGKSSLLEAVAWALYGSHAVRTAAAEVITTGAREPCRVRLEFDHAGETFALERVQKRSGTDASLRRGGEVLAQGAREVSAKVAGILGMDYQSFFATVFTRQGELDRFTDMRGEERRRTVERLLGVTRVNDAASEVRRRRREAGVRLDERRRQTVDAQGEQRAPQLDAHADALARELAGLEAQRGDRERELATVRQQREAAQRKWQVAEAAAKVHRKAERAAEAARHRAESAQRELEAARERLETLTQKEAQVAELAARTAALPVVERRVAELEAQAERARDRQAAERRVGEYEVELAAKRERAATLECDLARDDPTEALTAVEAKLAATREALAKLDRREGEAQARQATAQREAERLTRHLVEIRELGGETPCPTCRRPLGEHGPALVERLEGELDAADAEAGDEELKALAAERRDLVARQDAQQKREQALRETARAREAAAAELRGLALADAEATLAGARTAAAKLADTEPPGEALAEAKREHVELQAQARQREMLERDVAARPEREREAAAAKAAAGTARKAQRETATALAAVEYDEAAHRRTAEARDAAVEAFHAADAALRDHDRQTELKRRERDEVQRERERLAVLAKEISGIEADVTLHARLETLLKGFRSHLTGRIAPALAAHTSRLLERLTDGRYTQVAVDPHDYGLEVYDGGEAHALERYSGGEVDLVNLAFRLSISQLLADRAGAELGLVVLDEVLGSQDEMRQRRILGGLERLAEQVGQVMLVTHVGSVKDHLANVWEVQRDREGGTHIVFGDA